MRIYFDCEFLEDGRTIEPISIGMVREDGAELYLVNQDIEWTGEKGSLYDRICGNKWLMENVVPHLPVTQVVQPGPAHNAKGSFNLDTKDNRIVPLRYIRNAVREFVQGAAPVELWGYYSAYDHVLLAQLFGRMIDLPSGFPMWTNDVQQLAASLGLDNSLPTQTGTVHNALEDARWTAEAHTFLVLRMAKAGRL